MFTPDGGGLPLAEPALPPFPDRIFRTAFAPKLMRRTNGVLGAVRALPTSSSSTAFSSMESEVLVDMLERRALCGPGLDGEEPDRPKVEMERRRRWSFMAAVVMGPEKAEIPWDVELFLWKRLAKAAEVTEPRRGWSPEGALFALSLDMTTEMCGSRVVLRARGSRQRGRGERIAGSV